MALFGTLFKNPSAKALQRVAPLLADITSREETLRVATDSDLKQQVDRLRERARQETTDLDTLLPETFALVREAARRVVQMRPFDVQLLGGITLHQGKIAEMKTGEGKTLVATLPVTLNALAGRGVHVVTVNEYLASRDATWMGPVYEFLGLSVGVLQYGQSTTEKQAAYNADITYGTNNEFGFDYLRDNMVGDSRQLVQRGHCYAIVDEVDSILIDEARTPLIISAPAEESTDRYQQFAELARRMQEGPHYNKDEKLKAVALTDAGITFLEERLKRPNLYADASGVVLIHHIEQALRAQALFLLDRDYVVKDGEVIIVDPFTGRLMVGRRYSEGLHQAIEAKEGVAVQRENRTLATITFQNYFRLYAKLSGMTGTAATEAEEFLKIYGLDVVEVPTHKTMIRRDLSDRIYRTEEGKFLAVVAEVQERHAKGQPLLIGTIAIEKSERLSALLTTAGVPHEVLNAKNHAREAEIIAQAGQPGSVTISTNMAGRGTDIKLGEGVVKVGGLHVLGTERHESRRIDNQLRGRSGRQGDPGSSQFFVSLEDDLMRIFGSTRVQTLMERLGLPEDQAIENSMISRALESAQKKVEGNNFDIRKHLVEFDDVVNKQREIIYRRRREILFAWKQEQEQAAGTLPEKTDQPSLREQIDEMLTDEIEQVVLAHTTGEEEAHWNTKEITETLQTILPKLPADFTARLTALAEPHQQGMVERRTAVIDYVLGVVRAAYEEREVAMTAPVTRQVERAVLLRTADELWVEHLDAMDRLRESVRLRGYGQRDPLVEYKNESLRLFRQLLDAIRNGVVYSIFKVSLVQQPAPSVLEKAKTYAAQAGREKAASGPKVAAQKINRNDPCPCGSGKKYKKCHGQ